MDIRDKIRVIDYYLDLPSVMKKLGEDVSVGFNFLCPFHHDVNSKSAKFFKDDDGWRIHCFAERRQYRAHDYFRVKKLNIEKMYDSLVRLRNLTIEDIAKALEDTKSRVYEINLDYLASFKEGKISAAELLELVLQDLQVKLKEME